MSTATRLTNEEFVSDLMNFSSFGGLCQVFVIEAIRRYADQVAAAAPADVDTEFLSGAVWVGLAQEIKAKVYEQYDVDDDMVVQRADDA
jgi:hypothetical protein